MSRLNPAYLCAATMAHVDEFIDGELGPRECEGIEAHLLTCGSCRTAYQRELDLKNLIRKACACRGVPDDLKGRVLTRISELRIEVDGATFDSLTVRTTTIGVSATRRGPLGNDTASGPGSPPTLGN
jgi:mycothiol system anti-sigma-R factor